MPDQHDLFWKGYTGEQLKKAALDRFEAQEKPWLVRARENMVLLLEAGRSHVSSDEVWMYCPPPADTHPSCMGAVFKQSYFVVTGWKASTRPSAHARVIRTYRLRDDNE